MIMPDIWLSGVNWDDVLPETLTCEAREWFDELQYLPSLAIPRYIGLNKENADLELNTFVDASEKAYGTVVRVKTFNKNTKQISMVTAKSKVTPLTTMSIPRLQLMAAVLGVNVSDRVCCVIRTDISKVTFWTDN